MSRVATVLAALLLVLSAAGLVVPELGDCEGPLGVPPPIEGSLHIITVLLEIGAIGPVLSILRSDNL